jgi:hypothetical protein
MTKLQQNQFWKIDDGFVCIVHLERLSVGYKHFHDLAFREGSHHQVTKKEFTRLIKSGTLLTAEEVQSARGEKHF